MKYNDFTTRILIFLITAWLLLSLFRTWNNVSKIFTDEKSWIGISEDTARTMQFGDAYGFLKFLDQNTKANSSTLFFTDDLKTYYFGRYFLYPKKIIGEHEKHIWFPKATYYDYIVIYPATKNLISKANTESNIHMYNKIATFTDKYGVKALLYKK